MGVTPNGASAGGNAATKQDATSPNFRFLASDHAHSLLNCMKVLRDNRNLCDITLCVEDQEFPAHRIVLASCSPYFSAMFTNEHVESQQNRITLEGIEARMLESLLDFVYSSTVEISEENVQSLLTAASLLQLIPVVEACCEFLRVRLDPDNCLGIAGFAERYGCANLHEISLQFALSNFTEVAESDEFLAAQPQEIINLLKSEDVSVRSEEEVLDFILRWFRHDQLTRLTSISSVLQYVKLPLIPWQQLNEKILSDDQLSAIPECQFLVTSAKRYQSNPTPADYPLEGQEFSQYVPRKSINQGMFVYVVGGETSPGRNTVNTLEQFNPGKNTWRELAPMETNRRGVGVDILNGFLYAVGGSDGHHALRIVECYDPHTDTWTRLADMTQERSSVAVAAMKGYLYAIGGYDGIMSCLQGVERYDPTTNVWSEIASMNIQRSMQGVSVLNRQLVVVGGYDGASDLATCEMYDPETDTWTMMEEMHSSRCMAGVGVLNGLLYAVGGCDRSQSLSSMEVYDPAKNQWNILAEMAKARSGVGVAVVGRLLYAVGGYSGSGPDYCSSMERYDPDTNTWSFVAGMQNGRRRFGCCS